LKNHIKYETGIVSPTLSNILYYEFYRKYRTNFLLRYPETDTFKIVITSESEEQVQDDFSLIVLTLGEDGLEVITGDLVYLSMLKPFGCRPRKLIIVEQQTFDAMFEN